MMDEGKSRAFWGGLVLVFLLALLPRMFYPASRFMVWYPRSVRFWDALLAGDLSNTYQRYHPGVTTMWAAGFGMRVYMAVNGWSPDDLLDPPPMMSGPQGPPAQAAVVALSFVVAACIALVYVLLARLRGWPLAFSAGCLLALDPFYITYSKMIHLDALLASFMLLSVLSLIGFLEDKKWTYLVSSGVFTGLAFLTKSPSWFLISYAGLIVTLHHLLDRVRLSLDSSKMHIWGRRIWDVVRSLGVWWVVAVCVVFLLWPAMWVMPGKVLSRIARNALMHAETVHVNPNFFAGRVVDDPGPLYYVATLAWKTTLVTLPAITVAIVFLIRRWREEECRGWWYLLIFAGGYLAAMALGAKKQARYVLPSLAALDVLAAWGVVQTARALGNLTQLRKRPWIPKAVVAIALVTQTVAVLRHHPYYGTHHNLLLGGSRVARHILPLGDEGEGLDLAARFLNSYPAAERMAVGVQNMNNLMFTSNFAGRTRPIDRDGVDHRVFSVNDVQREFLADLWEDSWESCQETGPLWSVSFDGVPYVWICPAYPYDPEAFVIDHRLDVELGDHIRSLGYRLSSSAISAGDTLTVTLFWQSDGRLIEDYHIFVHLVDVDGQMVAQHDGVPVQGERPTWDWRDEEVLQDEHTLVTDADLPAATYTLSIGMYDYLTQARLQAVGPDGERLPEDRVVLQEVRVTPP
jgi:hypothetical protein